MTIFDTETDRYLERLGASRPSADWNDVLLRARRAQRRSRRAGVAVAGGTAVIATTVALATVGASGWLDGRSIVDKAEAAVLAPVRAAPGTIEHILVQYRASSRVPFIEYETWIAADGAWCRRTVEGVPRQAVADTRLTECRSSDGVMELYLPATNEILRTRPGARAGASADAGPAPDWLTEDIVDAFRREAVREAGTMTLDGREYTKLVTQNGLDTVLVDPETGEGVAWIPSADAFGVPTTVVRTRQTLPADPRSRRNLSLTELHPDAVVREVSSADRERAIASQFPRG